MTILVIPSWGPFSQAKLLHGVIAAEHHLWQQTALNVRLNCGSDWRLDASVATSAS